MNQQQGFVQALCLMCTKRLKTGKKMAKKAYEAPLLLSVLGAKMKVHFHKYSISFIAGWKMGKR